MHPNLNLHHNSLAEFLLSGHVIATGPKPVAWSRNHTSKQCCLPTIISPGIYTGHHTICMALNDTIKGSNFFDWHSCLDWIYLLPAKFLQVQTNCNLSVAIASLAPTPVSPSFFDPKLSKAIASWYAKNNVFRYDGINFLDDGNFDVYDDENYQDA